MPEEDVPMRSVSIASDGSALVAGNHKVGYMTVYLKNDAMILTLSYS